MSTPIPGPPFRLAAHPQTVAVLGNLLRLLSLASRVNPYSGAPVPPRGVPQPVSVLGNLLMLSAPVASVNPRPPRLGTRRLGRGNRGAETKMLRSRWSNRPPFGRWVNPEAEGQYTWNRVSVNRRQPHRPPAPPTVEPAAGRAAAGRSSSGDPDQVVLPRPLRTSNSCPAMACPTVTRSRSLVTRRLFRYTPPFFTSRVASPFDAARAVFTSSIRDSQPFAGKRLRRHLRGRHVVEDLEHLVHLQRRRFPPPNSSPDARSARSTPVWPCSRRVTSRARVRWASRRSGAVAVPAPEGVDPLPLEEREELQVAQGVGVGGVQPELVEAERGGSRGVEPDRPCLGLPELHPRWQS